MNFVGEKAEYQHLNDQVLEANLSSMMLPIVKQMRVRATVPIIEWAEKNLKNPAGGSGSQFYSRYDQPATAKFLEMAEDDRWRQITLIAPNQSGKSHTGILYVLNGLFNIQEDVIYGVPTISEGMWQTKYQKDFFPVIAGSKTLSPLMPERGRGTKGGTPTLVVYNNGHSLQAMGAGGNAHARAGATARKVVITELKDFGGKDNTGESTKFDQMKARMLRHQGREVIFAESTLTTTDNIAWVTYSAGTQTQAYFPCESCEWYICPEREQLVGWENARTVLEAMEKARFSCPVCGVLFEESQRKKLLQECVLLHDGQTMENGEVIGDEPQTNHLSFRFTASTNMFANAGSIGAMEWQARNEPSPKERNNKTTVLMQQIYAKAVDPDTLKVGPLEGPKLLQRCRSPLFENCPAKTTRLFGGVDVNNRFIHWTVTAFGVGMSPHIVAWMEERLLQDIPFEMAFDAKIREIQQRFRDGFLVEGSNRWKSVDWTLMDGNHQPGITRRACDYDPFWMPCIGRGEHYQDSTKYDKPTKVTESYPFIGEEFDIRVQADQHVAYFDASFWKGWLHDRLRLDMNSPGAISIATADEQVLLKLIAHLTSETEGVKVKNGISVRSFVNKHDRDNHLLDSTSYSCLAKHAYDIQWPDGYDYDPVVDHSPMVWGDGHLFGKSSV